MLLAEARQFHRPDRAANTKRTAMFARSERSTSCQHCLIAFSPLLFPSGWFIGRQFQELVWISTDEATQNVSCYRSSHAVYVNIERDFAAVVACAFSPLSVPFGKGSHQGSGKEKNCKNRMLTVIGVVDFCFFYKHDVCRRFPSSSSKLGIV